LSHIIWNSAEKVYDLAGSPSSRNGKLELRIFDIA